MTKVFCDKINVSFDMKAATHVTSHADAHEGTRERAKMESMWTCTQGESAGEGEGGEGGEGGEYHDTEQQKVNPNAEIASEFREEQEGMRMVENTGEGARGGEPAEKGKRDEEEEEEEEERRRRREVVLEKAKGVPWTVCFIILASSVANRALDARARGTPQ